MSGRGIRLGVGFLALALAGSAGAQGNLDQGKNRRSTLRVSLRDLPPIGAKRFQDQMVFRARKLPT